MYYRESWLLLRKCITFAVIPSLLLLVILIDLVAIAIDRSHASSKKGAFVLLWILWHLPCFLLPFTLGGQTAVKVCLKPCCLFFFLLNPLKQ